MKKQRTYLKPLGITLLLSFSSSALFAGNIADEQLDGGGLTLTPIVVYDSASLRITNNYFNNSNNYAVGDSISVNAGELEDGVYNYELSLVSNVSENAPNGSAATQSGSFSVQNGIANANDDAAQSAKAEAERLESVASQEVTSDSEK